ncbi:prepilin peptidase [Clostridium algidicarnis]|uniref:prepilin peptidase n=1 Tax=Clostridium algidicarnis TaxID=37659 RepID=UPI001CF18921|nr:A24 family peptidase [Clostridium algidicarnis]MCB2286433.1 prepilin peptidase [Clostridium algidicarnis]
MKIFLYIAIFLLGAIIGSFLNVCIYRIPLGESIAYPPSHCTNCDARLKWYDLIPIFSYLFLKGKCKYCKEKISLKYPSIEFFTATAFLITYINYGLSLYLIKYIILWCFLIVISIIDIKFQDVYAVTTIPGIIIGVIIATIENVIYFTPFWNYLLGGAIAGGVIALIVYITGGMGKGDIEIAALCGVFIGWKYSIIMIFLSFIIGAIIGVILIISKKRSRKDYIAFGPFIALSALFTVFYGSHILNYYVGLFT